MQRQLTGKTMGGTTSDFLPLLDAASRALSNLETEVPSTIGQLRYDNQRGHIIIDLRVNSIDILESYKEQLTAEALTVDILSANQDQEMVNGRMQISR
jgi:type II secretory pathway component PulL